MSFSIQEIAGMIKENERTLIAVDINGVVKNCIPFRTFTVSLDEYKRIIMLDENKNCAVSFIPQNPNIKEKDIQKKIRESVEDLKYSRTHDLKPGINIPFRYNKFKQLVLFAWIIAVTFILWIEYKILGLASAIGSIIVFIIFYLTKKGFQRRPSK